MKVFGSEQQALLVFVGLAIFLIALFRPFHPFWSTLRSSPSNVSTEPHRQSIIQVAGAIKNPGIYTFDKPPTAYQAIQSAGGPVGEHDLSFDKAGDTLDTGMKIERLNSPGKRAQLIITPIGSRERLILGLPINLNQASIEDLALVPGISHRLARRIVDFRESHGPFRTWNDLRCVKGVGPRNVESFRSYLCLE